MSTALKVILGIVIVGVVIAAVAAFVLFGPPGYAEEIAQPEYCINCHIMKPQYETYKASVHGTVTDSCNDCHLPNTGFLRHWTADAYVGMRDLIEWNLNLIPEEIEAKPLSEGWLDENCRRCHQDVITDIHPPAGRECWDCHRDVTHKNPGRKDRSVRQPAWKD